MKKNSKKQHNENDILNSNFDKTDKTVSLLIDVTQLLEERKTTIDEAIKIATIIIFNALEDNKTKPSQIKNYLDYVTTKINQIIKHKQK